jgi:hypothetical protein
MIGRGLATAAATRCRECESGGARFPGVGACVRGNRGATGICSENVASCDTSRLAAIAAAVRHATVGARGHGSTICRGTCTVGGRECREADQEKGFELHGEAV